jgi:hypothetical protein
MTKLLGCLFVILIVILLGSGAGAALPQKSKVRRNASGIWNLDVASSEFGEAPKPKSAHLTVSMKGDRMSWTSDVVAADGTRMKQFFDGAIDGKEYPVRSEPDAGAVSASYTLNKDGTTHATLKSPTGRMEMTISISRDAKTLIIKNELLDNSGEKVTWSEVWRRI